MAAVVAEQKAAAKVLESATAARKAHLEARGQVLELEWGLEMLAVGQALPEKYLVGTEAMDSLDNRFPFLLG